jgi:hypothetical protein
VFSRGQLLNAVWGYTHDGYEHTVTTHINRLRAKLEADPMRPQLILTVRGAGYKMREKPGMSVSVRLKIALTIFATGLVTALAGDCHRGLAFQRFEHETTYQRATGSSAAWSNMYDNLFDMHQRQPDEFNAFLRNLVLFEPDTQLYLLDPQAPCCQHRHAKLAPGFKVALGPVLRPIDQPAAPYVMGDDPERMDADAVIAAVPLRRARSARSDPVAATSTSWPTATPNPPPLAGAARQLRPPGARPDPRHRRRSRRCSRRW